MRRRLYFVLPDIHSARRTVDDLLLARINHRNMHFLASRGTDLGELREANVLQKSDLVHGAELGMIIGGVGGVVIGLMIVLAPPEGVDMQMITVLVSSIAGALLGGFIGRFAGLYGPGDAAGFIMSTLGAVALLFAYRKLRPA